MVVKGGVDCLTNNLFRQLDALWEIENKEIISRNIKTALDRMETILRSLNNNKYVVWGGDEVQFSPLNTVQYTIFLWLLSNEIYKNEGNVPEADMVYYLNKALNGCELFYEIEFPETFYAEHPVGSVMGRAKYGKNFFFYQGCTVGGNRNRDGKLFHPTIGDNVLMYSNSSILGDSVVGNNVILSSGTTVINDRIPNNVIVFGKSPKLIIKEYSSEEMYRRLGIIWKM